MNFETIPSILAIGFGRKALVGMLMGFLKPISPYRCYEYITSDMELLHFADDDELQKYRGLISKAQLNVNEITLDEITTSMRKNLPELLSIIINTPGGRAWLDKQITLMKAKLSL